MFRSRTLEYAILASTEVAKADGELVMCAVVAETFNLPKDSLARVMCNLAKARVLRSDRGLFRGADRDHARHSRIGE